MIRAMNASERPTRWPREARHGRDERDDARSDGDRDGEDVVGEERSGTDEARERAEVVLGDDVGAAGGLVDAHGLLVGDDHDREQGSDRDRDGQELASGR